MHSSSTLSQSDDGASFPEVLNEPQLAAVTHPSGPLLVLAGAGSGKTRVITYRIAHLVAMQRVPPYRVLAVTFTNKAAREMRERIERLVGPDIAHDLWVGTFHATCARLLRRYHDAVGLAREFVIYDDADQRAVMNRVVKDMNLDDRRFPPKLLLSAIHDHKQHGRRPDEVPTDTRADQVLVQAFEAYQRRLLAANAVDFDDLILHIMRLVEDDRSVAGDELRRRFDHLLVDEFQDVNSVQYRLVRAMVKHHDNICVVGDDDQSIYRWRGADVRIIRGFNHDFPAARVVKLEQNYRSSANVVRAALGVIQPSPERQPKELFTDNPPGAKVMAVSARDEHDEAAFVVSSIRKAMDAGIDPKQIAVFYRVHAQSRVLEEVLRSENVPYQIVGGTRFFDRAEIKDLLAYLRVLANPASDVDLLRIINVPARQIGQATVTRLVEAANASESSVYQVIAGDLRLTTLKPAPRKRVAALASTLQQLRSYALEHGPRELAERVLVVTGYQTNLQHENSAEADARLENLKELLGSIEEYQDESLAAGESPSLSGYLERVSLVSDVDQIQDVRRVSLMTVHAAKGLEFELVFVTGAEENLFPYRSNDPMSDPGQLEEERRLAYVAFTRARDQLVVTYAGSRMIFGTTRYANASRFLADLPPDVLEHLATPAMGRIRAPTNLHRAISEPPRHAPVRAVGERYIDREDADVCPPDDVPLEPGIAVIHKRYGEGRIEELHLSQTPPIAVVLFPGWGRKKIAISFLQPA